MADDKKKPKINLKDRLGKTNIGTQSVPLPVPGQSSPGAPQGIAPPPGITPGIPVPPFAQPKAAAAEAPAPKPTVVQQTIKVEVGEEIIKEREKAKKQLIGAAIGTALLGIAIGYAVGGQASTAARGKAVIQNAKALMGDIKGANEKMKELDTLLGEAVEKLQKKEYPAELSGQLGALNIPFDASKVDGGAISGLKPSALRQLLKFTSSCEELNDKKDKLKSLLDFAKDPVSKAWKEEKEPVMNFSVTFRADQKGVIAEFVPTKDPFDIGKDWPANYSVMKTERGKAAEKKVNRYTKGDLPGTDVVIPVDPTTTAVFTSQEGIRNLRKAFLDLREELKGDGAEPEPSEGSIELGDKLLTELQKVTQGG
ncbi:MAG TPA: formin [Polyangium sp.]|nr:formin [Polyangium sp.]